MGVGRSGVVGQHSKTAECYNVISSLYWYTALYTKKMLDSSEVHKHPHSQPDPLMLLQ